MNLVEFDPILKRASSLVKAEYFSLPASAGGALRERIYCYELYHQLRSLWPLMTEAILNGELDKTQNPMFTGKLKNIKPDLLVHKPGPSRPEDRRNLIAVEVKPADASPARLKADLESLNDLMTSAYYQRGILLVYGLFKRSSPAKNRKVLTARLKRICLQFHPAQPIEVWIHEACECEARLFATCRGGTVVMES